MKEKYIIKKREVKPFYHINCGVIKGFPALRKAVTTHLKKYRIALTILNTSCLSELSRITAAKTLKNP